MYIHIGEEISLIDQWIVCVLDLDRSTSSRGGVEELLLCAEREGRLQLLGPGLPRSIVITLDRIYLSPVRPETLLERCRRAAAFEKRVKAQRRPGRT